MERKKLVENLRMQADFDEKYAVVLGKLLKEPSFTTKALRIAEAIRCSAQSLEAEEILARQKTIMVREKLSRAVDLVHEIEENIGETLVTHDLIYHIQSVLEMIKEPDG